MPLDTLKERQHDSFCWTACKHLASTDDERRRLRRSFNTMNGALVSVETAGIEALGGPELPQLISVMRSGDATSRAKSLPFLIHTYLQQLRAQLLRQRDQQVFQVSLLDDYLRLTKQAWQVCRNEGEHPDSFVPYDRYLLATVIKAALEQSDTRESS